MNINGLILFKLKKMVGLANKIVFIQQTESDNVFLEGLQDAVLPRYVYLRL